MTLKGSNLVEWKDKNNAKISAKQAVDSLQPKLVQNVFNGSPVIRFSGGQFMEANKIFPVGRDYTIFIIASISNNAYANNILSGDNHAIYYNPPRILHQNFSTQSISYYGFTLNVPSILTVRYIQSTRYAEVYVDGLLGDSALIGTNIDSVLYLGAYQKANFLAGDIAEVIIYNRSLSKAEQTQVQDYLFTRYAITKPKQPQIDNTFTEVPAAYQLYPRDINDSAEVRISGNFAAAGFDSIYTKVYKDNLQIGYLSQALKYNSGKAPFSLKTKIHAELNHYKFIIAVKNSTIDSVITVRDSVVCGDVVLINGQSNTVVGGNPYTNEFIRTFGGNFSTSKRDTLWSLANGYASGGGSCIGGWGMRLAQLLIENQQVPVCVLNGGVGGTIVEQHLRDASNKYNLNTIYGSFLYRAEKSKLRNAARYLFWYQGESNTITNYYTNFKTLYNYWMEDFPNLKKIYMVQIHPGCAGGLHSELRNLQRMMNDTIKGIPIETLAASGLPGHDGCHYALEGYLALGKQLYRLLARDFYNSSDIIAISSPNIYRAFFTGKNNTQLALLFKPKLSNLYAQPDTIVSGIKASMKDYFYLSDSVKIKSISCSGDTVFLNLQKASNAQYVTYLPDQTYTGTSVIYEGPWLYNQRGVGALSFDKFPVTEKPSLVLVKNEDNNTISIKSNPNNGNFDINLKFNKLQEAEIKIFDNLGKLIYSKSLGFLDAGSYTFPISINVANGIYYCQLVAGETSRMITFIIEK